MAGPVLPMARSSRASSVSLRARLRVERRLGQTRLTQQPQAPGAHRALPVRPQTTQPVGEPLALEALGQHARAP